MKLVVGLGNPGRRYERTRHNLGFRVVDELAARWRIETNREKFESWFGEGTVAGERAVLLKPLTFMNLSGQAVQAAVAFYKVPLENVIVVMDDLDLPAGRLRVRAGGSSGGHRGLASVIERLGGDEVARVRIGIGRSGHADAVDHVLSPVSSDDEAVIEAAVRRGADAVEHWLVHGVAAAMNEFNRTERRRDGAGPEAPEQGAGP